MKLKIDNETLAREFFEDSILLGIVAPVKDYQLCWQLNQLLGFDFRINNDFEIQLTKKERKYFFSIYEYHIPSTCLTHYLYNNQFAGEYWDEAAGAYYLRARWYRPDVARFVSIDPIIAGPAESVVR